MILILSISSVSADTLSDGNSLKLIDNAEISDLNGVGENSDNIENIKGNSLSDSASENSEENLAIDDAGSIGSVGSVDVKDGAGSIGSVGSVDVKDDAGSIGSVKSVNDGIDDVDSVGNFVNDKVNHVGIVNEDCNNIKAVENNVSNDNDAENTTLMNATIKIIPKNNWKIYTERNYTVKLLDGNNHPIANAKIKFKIKTPNGKCISRTALTNERGIAILNFSFNLRGVYNVNVSYDGNSEYNPAKSVNSNVQFYERTIFKISKYGFRSCNVAVKLQSSKGNCLAKKKVFVYVNNIRYTRITDSKGRVYVRMPSDRRLVRLNCIFPSCDYYEKSNRTMKLPVYKRTILKPLNYVILRGKSLKVLLKGRDGKILRNQKVKITINGRTYTRKTNGKGIAYLRVSFKRNVYDVSVSYGNNSIYGPSTRNSNLEVIDRAGQFKKGLNQMTSLSVSKYLSGGGRAKVTKSIKRLAKKITKKYSTKLEKAAAIYNYVRDTLNYEYYANSKKGAAKTLKSKAGNCCDHSNLIVALCRAVKIPARYAHAQGCKFSDGDVEGHVWAQIYVDGKWYSADGTSYRNSLGHVSNWDTKHYYSLKIYRNIPF